MLNRLRAECVRKGPNFMRYPLSFTPFAVKKHVLQQVLCWQFSHALAEGELDFLEGRWLGIDITDLGLCWRMTVREGRIELADGTHADAWFRGQANDLLLIAARRQDPDTLFFQRRLIIEGDTELGLEVKNLMDAIELETLPAPLRIGLLKLASFVEAGLNEDANSSLDCAGKLC
ncbi:Predicted lipid carrier protein YhbT, contains SCP2 domain [Izhakiella capsodis]|uniref:Ubiquinone biosynthesis accessory factor UbiT n=1 Tax=Izhakiella capsodis TaxID=1367852 RepID=A0A1I4XJ08_9GAMM|nr:Predicted lipid carrier protein YhbT, contains SCP2 domain [Izhakiella capsodis]